MEPFFALQNSNVALEMFLHVFEHFNFRPKLIILTRGVPTAARSKRDSLAKASNAFWMKSTRRNKRSTK